MVTPFDGDGRVDEDATARLIRHLLDNGSGRRGDGQHDRRELDPRRRGEAAAVPARGRRGRRRDRGGQHGLERHAPLGRADRARHRDRGRRRDPRRHAVLQQAEPARDRRPLPRDRGRHGPAGDRLQHPLALRGRHPQRPAGRARPGREHRGREAGARRAPRPDRRHGPARGQRRHVRRRARHRAARAGSWWRRRSSARRCAG